MLWNLLMSMTLNVSQKNCQAPRQNSPKKPTQGNFKQEYNY